MTAELRAFVASVVLLIGTVFCFPLYLVGKGGAATDAVCQIAAMIAGD